MKKYTALVLSLALLSSTGLKGQEWGGIPGFNTEGPFVLIDQNSFLILMGAALSSYGIAELATDKGSNLNYYNGRLGVYGSSAGLLVHQNFGIEKRLAPWFGIGLELVNQQWIAEEGNGAGLGLNTYYRWHLFGSKKISPYLEYGAGVFNGFSPLPADGTRFTFHLNTQLGLEYKITKGHLMRLSYGHLHQSNNDLLDLNPGLDGGGFNFTFLWFWDESNWKKRKELP